MREYSYITTDGSGAERVTNCAQKVAKHIKEVGPLAVIKVHKRKPSRVVWAMRADGSFESGELSSEGFDHLITGASTTRHMASQTLEVHLSTNNGIERFSVAEFMALDNTPSGGVLVVKIYGHILALVNANGVFRTDSSILLTDSQQVEYTSLLAYCQEVYKP